LSVASCRARLASAAVRLRADCSAARLGVARRPGRLGGCIRSSWSTMTRSATSRCLRDRGNESTPLLHLGKITIDLARREAYSPQGDLHLTPLEYRVLESLDGTRARLSTTR